MSSYHYAISLYWDRTQGHAHYDGVSITLRKQPHVPGLPEFEAITYAPATLQCRVCPKGGGWIDMSEPECMATRAWLARMADATRRTVAEWCSHPPYTGAERRTGDRRATTAALLVQKEGGGP